MHNPDIRHAIRDDAPQLAALLSRVFTDTYGSAIPPALLAAYLDRAFAPQQVAAELCSSKILHFVTVRDDEIVALCKLAPGNPTGHQLQQPVELARLYVDSRLHGQGIAGALLQRTLGEARSRGYTTIWLCVWEQNARALAFYSKHGFRQFGRMPVFVDTIRFDDILLQRNLDDY